MVEPEESVPEVRLSNADRDAAVARLSTAMAEGRLDPDEFAERSRAIYGARVPSELEPLLVDVPPIAASPPTPVPVAPRKRRRWIVSLIGDRRRSGAWDPGDQTVAVTVIGDQRLDLSEVTAAADVIAIRLIGDTHITVSHSAEVHFSGFTLLGDVEDEVDAPAPGPRRVVRVRCYGLIGDVIIRRGSG